MASGISELASPAKVGIVTLSGEGGNNCETGVFKVKEMDLGRQLAQTAFKIDKIDI